MRAEWELRKKLAEALSKPNEPGTHKPHLYWEQAAALCVWALQDPAPVIDEAVRARAQATANKTKSCRFIRATPSATLVTRKAIGKCELIEPQGGRK